MMENDLQLIRALRYREEQFNEILNKPKNSLLIYQKCKGTKHLKSVIKQIIEKWQDMPKLNELRSINIEDIYSYLKIFDKILAELNNSLFYTEVPLLRSCARELNLINELGKALITVHHQKCLNLKLIADKFKITEFFTNYHCVLEHAGGENWFHPLYNKYYNAYISNFPLTTDEITIQKENGDLYNGISKNNKS